MEVEEAEDTEGTTTVVVVGAVAAAVAVVEAAAAAVARSNRMPSFQLFRHFAECSSVTWRRRKPLSPRLTKSFAITGDLQSHLSFAAALGLSSMMIHGPRKLR